MRFATVLAWRCYLCFRTAVLSQGAARSSSKRPPPAGVHAVRWLSFFPPQMHMSLPNEVSAPVQAHSTFHALATAHGDRVRPDEGHV